MGRGCGSGGTVSNGHAAETGLIPQCGKGFFFQSQLSVQTLLRCLYSPCVQSHALASVHMIKIQNNGSNTFVWTHKNTARTVRNG